MNRAILKHMFWSGVIAAAWCLSMIHAEHVGMRRQASAYNHEAFAAYQRGLKDATNEWKPAFDNVAAAARNCGVTQKGSVNVNGSSGDVSIR